MCRAKKIFYIKIKNSLPWCHYEFISGHVEKKNYLGVLILLLMRMGLEKI